jgi:hypothetical protein
MWSRLVISLAILSIALQGCGGAGGSVCPPGAALTDSDWRAGLETLDESIRLAEAGDGQGASRVFFSSSHDLSHRAVVTACPHAEAVAKDLSTTLDDFHFQFQPDDSAVMKAELSKVRQKYIQAAAATGIRLQ